jgi:hypothetical protein
MSLTWWIVYLSLIRETGILLENGILTDCEREVAGDPMPVVCRRDIPRYGLNLIKLFGAYLGD